MGKGSNARASCVTPEGNTDEASAANFLKKSVVIQKLKECLPWFTYLFSLINSFGLVLLSGKYSIIVL